MSSPGSRVPRYIATGWALPALSPVTTDGYGASWIRSLVGYEWDQAAADGGQIALLVAGCVQRRPGHHLGAKFAGAVVRVARLAGPSSLKRKGCPAPDVGPEKFGGLFVREEVEGVELVVGH